MIPVIFKWGHPGSLTRTRPYNIAITSVQNYSSTMIIGMQ